MSNELKESLIIGIELILFGFIILIIAMFGDYARDAFILKEARNQGMSDIKEYRNIYNLTEGAEIDLADSNDPLLEGLGLAPSDPVKHVINVPCVGVFNTVNYNLLEAAYFSNVFVPNIVKGDDIVRFASLYPKEYNLFIKIDDNEANNILLKDVVGITETLDEDEQEAYRRIWEIAVLSDTLCENVNSYFLCFACYNSSLCQYPGMIFVKIPFDKAEYQKWGVEFEEKEEAFNAP